MSSGGELALRRSGRADGRIASAWRILRSRCLAVNSVCSRPVPIGHDTPPTGLQSSRRQATGQVPSIPSANRPASSRSVLRTMSGSAICGGWSGDMCVLEFPGPWCAPRPVSGSRFLAEAYSMEGRSEERSHPFAHLRGAKGRC